MINFNECFINIGKLVYFILVNYFSENRNSVKCLIWKGGNNVVYFEIFKKIDFI